jgi:hypothetical protein
MSTSEQMVTSEAQFAGLPPLNVLFFKEEGFWVAQCLQFDVTAQGETLPEARKSFERVLVAQILSDLQEKRQPLSSVPSAPAKFWQWYRSRAATTLVGRGPLRRPGMADDRYRVALDAATEEVTELLAQLADRKQFANMLALKAGLPAPYTDIETPGASALARVRADQFANYTYPSEAARAFLEWRGHEKGAAKLDAIFDALDQGGFSWGSSRNDPKGGLRIALGKDGLVRKLSNGSYGLWEWYPNAKKPSKKGATARSDDEGDNGADESQGDTPPPASTVGEPDK